MYRKRPPCIVNRTLPKIIAISVHTVNRFPLTIIIRGKVGIPLTGLTKPHLCACSKLWTGFQSWSFLYSMIWPSLFFFAMNIFFSPTTNTYNLNNFFTFKTYYKLSGHGHLLSNMSHTATRKVSCRITSLYLWASPGFLSWEELNIKKI